MGNSCHSFVARGSSAGLTPGQRTATMEKYRLTESQIRRVEGLFKKSATNKKYLTFKDFRELYAESRFDHDDEDIVAVFRALGEPASQTAKPGKKLPAADFGSGTIDRVTFDGFVRLTLLCRNHGNEEVPGNGKHSSGKHGSEESNNNGGGKNSAVEGGGRGGDTLDASAAGDAACDLIDQDRMRVLFDVMDSDLSGTISESEFHRFILNFVDDKSTSSSIFGKLDHDKNRTIDFDEFCVFCRKHRKIFRAMCSYVLPID